MTFDERVTAIATHGFTERQSRFLVTVLLHAGVCVVRQYCAFSHIARGQVTHEFFGMLVSRKYATVYDDAHRHAHVFHIQHRALYAAVGEPDSRFRKPTPVAVAVERLMILDAVLAAPHVSWLASERDKLAHFTTLLGTGFRREDLPQLAFGRPGATTVRYFPDKLPVGIEPDGYTHVFAYLVTRTTPVDFRAFLHRHAELLRALRRWRLWLLVPRHLVKATASFHAAVYEELAAPLRPAVADDVLWYFRRRTSPPATADPDRSRFEEARQSFGAPRYRALYRTWQKSGRACVDATVSRTLADALERGTGVVDTHVLAHPYLHLSPLVGTA